MILSRFDGNRAFVAGLASTGSPFLGSILFRGPSVRRRECPAVEMQTNVDRRLTDCRRRSPREIGNGAPRRSRIQKGLSATQPRPTMRGHQPTRHGALFMMSFFSILPKSLQDDPLSHVELVADERHHDAKRKFF